MCCFGVVLFVLVCFVVCLFVSLCVCFLYGLVFVVLCWLELRCCSCDCLLVCLDCVVLLCYV